MVRATGHVGGHAFWPRRETQRRPSGRHRGTGRTAGSFDHLHAPGKPDFTHGRRAQRAVCHRLDVGRVMRQRQLTVAGAWRRGHAHLRQLTRHAIPQKLVFRHRKAVPCRQGQHKVIGVESLQRVGQTIRSGQENACNGRLDTSLWPQAQPGWKLELDV